MNIVFRKTFEKDLRKINDRSLLTKVKNVITAVEEATSLDDITNLKKLKGDEGYFRIRIGDYRLGIFLDGETILFGRSRTSRLRPSARAGGSGMSFNRGDVWLANLNPIQGSEQAGTRPVIVFQEWHPQQAHIGP